MKETVFWLFLSISTLALSLSFAYRAGRAMGIREQPQLLSTNKDLMRERKALQGQIAAARDSLSEVVYDPRTHAHTRLQLERVLEKCQTRAKAI
jgi:hypothetical protein